MANIKQDSGSKQDYNKRKQTGGTEFGIGQDTLAVNAQGSKFSKEGIRKRYGNLAQGAIQTGMEGISGGITNLKSFQKGQNLANVQEETKANIASFMQGNPNSLLDSEINAEVEKNIAAEQSVGDYYEEEAYRTLGSSTSDGIKISGDDSIGAINLALDNTKAKMKTAGLAFVQGRSSEEQYQNAMNNTAKKFLALHPSQKDEIIAEMNYMSKLAGVSDYRSELKSQRDAIQANIEYSKKQSLDKYLQRYSTPPVYTSGPLAGQTDWDVVNSDNAEWDKTVGNANRVTEQIASINKYNAAEKAQNIHELTKKDPKTGRSLLDDATYVELFKTAKLFNRYPDNIPPEDQAKAIAEVNELHDQAVMRANYTLSEGAGDANIDKNVGLFINQLEAMKNATISKINGTDKKKTYENSVKILEDQAAINFLQKTGITKKTSEHILELFRDVGGLPAMLGGEFATPETRALAHKIMLFMSNSIQLVNDKVEGIDKKNKNLNDTDLDIEAAVEGTKVLKEIIGSGKGEEMNLGNPNWERDMTSQTVIDGINSTSSNISGMKNPVGVTFLNKEKLFDEYISGNNPTFLTNLTDEARDVIDTSSKDWIKQVDDDIVKELDNLSERGIKIKTTIDNGRLSFRSLSIDKSRDGSGVAADSMNAMYSERFQKFIKLTAKLENKNFDTEDDRNQLIQNTMESFPNLSSLASLVKEMPSTPSAPKEQTQEEKLPPSEFGSEAFREQLLQGIPEPSKGVIKKKDSPEVDRGESLWEEGLERAKDLVVKAGKVADYVLPTMNPLPPTSPDNPNGMDKKENRFSFDTVESPELNELVERHFTRKNKEGKGLNIKGSEKHTRNNWEIPKKILADLANKFAWTESRNRQSIKNSEGSTATGLYQFLVGTQAERDAKKNTSLQSAITRVKSKLNNPPAWLDKLYKDGKVGELTRDQQTLLLLGDLLEKKGGDELWKIMLDPKSQDGTGEKYRKAQYDMYIKLHHTDKKGVSTAVKANAQKHILYVNKYYH